MFQKGIKNEKYRCTLKKRMQEKNIKKAWKEMKNK